MTIPRLYGVVANGPGKPEWKFPAPGKAHWLDLEGKGHDEELTLADGGVAYDMAYDAAGNLGIVIGTRDSQGGTVVAGLSAAQLVEAVSWLADTAMRHDAIGRSIGSHPATGAIEACEKIARNLAEVSAETTIIAKRKTMLLKLARELSRQVQAELRRFYQEARGLALVEVRAKVKALAKAAMEPDRAEREFMVKQCDAFIREALELDRSAFDKLLQRVDVATRRAADAG